MIKTATIFRHCRSDPSGTVNTVLRERGVDVTHIASFYDPVTDMDPLAPDLLVVTGGSPGVYQADLYPFLKDEMRIIAARLAADRPTLGICLGAQMMAGVLGARVYKGENGHEHGWKEITVTPAGLATPARHFDRAHTQVMQRHGDTFDLPSGAVLLAQSAQYSHQMFQSGRNAIGIQFHPEMTMEILHGWFIEYAYDAYAGLLDLQAIREQTARHLPVMERQTRAFLNEWLDHVGTVV